MKECLLTLLMAACVQDPGFKTKKFEEQGIVLRVPEGWRIISSKDPRLLAQCILREDGLKPEPTILIRHDRPGRPNTLSGFMTEAQIQAEGALIAPELLEETKLEVSGLPAFMVRFKARTDKDLEKGAEIEAARAGLLLEMRRYVLIDMTWPAGSSERFKPLLQSLLEGIETIPIEEPGEIAKGYKAYEEVLEKLSSFPTPVNQEQLLDYDVGKETVGEFRFSVKDVAEGDVPGFRVERHLVLDLKEGGRSESHLTGFLAADASKQTIELKESVVTNGLTREYAASGSIESGRATLTLNVLGEESRADFEVPTGTLFHGFLEVMLLRTVEYGRLDIHVPMLSPFDAAPFALRIESSELQKLRVNGVSTEAHILFVDKGEGTHVTWYIDGKRKIIHMKDRPFYMKEKK